MLIVQLQDSSRRLYIHLFRIIREKRSHTISIYLIPSSPLPAPKIANCGEVCTSQLVPLRHKPPEEEDDDEDVPDWMVGDPSQLFWAKNKSMHTFLVASGGLKSDFEQGKFPVFHSSQQVKLG